MNSAPQQSNTSIPKETGHAVLLYDGVCGLCNHVVQFVLPRDTRQQFFYASLQSDYAKDVLRRYGKDTETLSTVYCLENANTPKERLYSKSGAAICVASKLAFPASLLAAGKLVPEFLRDAMYDFVATNRYKWFGKHDVCMAPTAQDRERFLG